MASVKVADGNVSQASNNAVNAVGSPDNNGVVKFDVIFDKIQQTQLLLREIQSQLKTAHKDFSKAIKENNLSKKKSKKNKDGNANTTPRAPSGFAKPTKLSPALCAFLNISEDTLLARTDVTRKINQYIKDNNLQDTTDRRNISPDAALKSLLDPNMTEPLTYFNLQRSIKHHFIKAEVAAA